MNREELVSEFRQELPFYLRCTVVTAEKTAYQVDRFLRWADGDFPSSFTREQVVRFLSHLASTAPAQRSSAKGKARREASSVNDILKGMRRFARWALVRDYITVDPTAGIKGLAQTNRVILAPEPQQVRKVLSIARNHGETPELQWRNFAIFCLLTDTGIRSQELLKLNYCDVFAGRRFTRKIMIQGKGGKERLAPLSPEVRAPLRAYMKLRRPMPNEKALFVDHFGRRMTYPGLRNTLKRICERAGIHVGIHDFRRFTHTQLWLKGINQIDGMMLSGHVMEKDYRLYIRNAMQQRALKEHAKRRPLQAVISLKDYMTTDPKQLDT